jgi:hypothetical protein
MFLTQWVGTTLCLHTGLMMIETGMEANPPRTSIKKFGSDFFVALLQQEGPARWKSGRAKSRQPCPRRTDANLADFSLMHRRTGTAISAPEWFSPRTRIYHDPR